MKRALNIIADLPLPLDAITQTFGILAVRGAGKSNLAASMAEEMYTAKLPFVVIDPVGSWWGLRSSGDGKGVGLEVPIFGGRHGDVPLERTAGVLIADLVVDQRMTCVLDVSEFSEGDKIRFLIDFAERLYRRNTEPLHLFLEEADDYCPQRPMREQARLLRAWENIVRRGRARGLGITMITQRSAALNKNVLTQIETLFVLRTTSPQDRHAIEGWVKYQAEQAAAALHSLATLDSGEAWVWSPSWLKVFKRVKVRRRFTFDSGATPKTSTGTRAPATLADVDLGAIKERMAATIERAKLEDPKELRAELARRKKRIGELQRELEQLTAKKAKTVERPVITDKQLSVLHDAARGPAWLIAQVEKWLERLHAAQQDLRASVAQAQHLRGAEAKVFLLNEQHTTHITKAQARRERRETPPRPTNGHVNLGNTGMRRMLVALCQSHGPITTSQLAIRTSIARRGGTFRTYVGKLLTEGLAQRVGDRLEATDLGREKVGDYEPLPTGSALLEHWITELGDSGAARMLRAIADEHPKALGRVELSEITGMAIAGGTFRTYLGKLKMLELVEGKGELRLSADLVD